MNAQQEMHDIHNIKVRYLELRNSVIDRPSTETELVVCMLISVVTAEPISFGLLSLIVINVISLL
jgi:hypothetical protein